MSHYLIQRALPVKMDDEMALVVALKKLGIPFERAKVGQTLPLYGWQGKKRKERARVVIRRKDIGSAANDLGFNPQTGSVVISEFDSIDAPGSGMRVLKKILPVYATARVVRRARAQGARVTVKPQKDGGYQVIIVGAR